VDNDEIDRTVREVRAGRLEAYRDLIALAEGRVRLVLASLLPDPASIDDLAQEVFLHIHDRLRDYQPGTDFLSWVREIARHYAQNERRRWVRRREATRRYRVRLELTLESDLAELARTGDDAADALHDCVGRLEKTSRAVVEAFYWDGRPGPAIADSLGRSAEWVRIVLHRARAAVGRCLDAKGVLHGP
jgi:RNA polymerase sigma-70 factor, ECF subfamily